MTIMDPDKMIRAQLGSRCTIRDINNAKTEFVRNTGLVPNLLILCCERPVFGKITIMGMKTLASTNIDKPLIVAYYTEL